MPALFRLSMFFALSVFAFTGHVRAQEAPIVFANGQGAFFEFSADETGAWRWTKLGVPGGFPEGRAVAEFGAEIIAADATVALSTGWILAESSPEKLILEQDLPDAGLRFRRVFSFGPATNVARIETWVQSLDGEKILARVSLLGVRVAGEDFHETGGGPSSFPVFGQAMFAGIEHVSGTAQAAGDTLNLTQTPHVRVGGEWQFVATAIVGWVPTDGPAITPDDSPIRAAFLRYLDSVRIKPERIELHTNTWWTLPLPFSEKDVLKDIDALQKGFFDRTGMFFDSYALDLGWSNMRSVWRADPKRFPNEFRTINERLDALGCKLGLWISPGSAYPEGLDNTWLKAQGYEVMPWSGRLSDIACFSFGNNYQQAVKASMLDYAVRYGLGHVKLDFMNRVCDVATHGHPVGGASSYAIDAGLADVLDSLRAARPGIALEPLVCGVPPSPWWTMHTPFVLGPIGDDVPYGRVASPEWMESLITARDVAYRASQQNWIMPTQALETFDIVVQSPGDFQNMAVMAVGRGRWFISTYLKPELMKPTDWDFLAALVRWERANKQFLGNALMFGGNPAEREAYGYVFHNPDKEIYCARNPWIEAATLRLPGGVPVEGARELRMIYPRRQTLARIEAGAAMPTITLAPYETVLLETVPAEEETALAEVAEPPVAVLEAEQPRMMLSVWKNLSTLHFAWNGTLTVPEVNGAELCVLVQGTPTIKGATGSISLASSEYRQEEAREEGSEESVRVVTSEGQFGAAADPSPDHWTWFLLNVAPGQDSFAIDLSFPAQDVTVGVFLRGTVSAPSAGVAEAGAFFPTFRADQRGWSQTLMPLQKYSSTGEMIVPEEPQE